MPRALCILMPPVDRMWKKSTADLPARCARRTMLIAAPLPLLRPGRDAHGMCCTEENMPSRMATVAPEFPACEFRGAILPPLFAGGEPQSKNVVKCCTGGFRQRPSGRKFSFISGHFVLRRLCRRRYSGARILHGSCLPMPLKCMSPAGFRQALRPPLLGIRDCLQRLQPRRRLAVAGRAIIAARRQRSARAHLGRVGDTTALELAQLEKSMQESVQMRLRSPIRYSCAIASAMSGHRAGRAIVPRADRPETRSSRAGSRTAACSRG